MTTLPKKSKKAKAPKVEEPEASVLIWIVVEILSDKSKVYNVELIGQKFAARSEDDAIDLAEAFKSAINEHTCEIADVVVGY